MSEADLNKDRLALALEAAGLDLWENNLVTGEVTRKAGKTLNELGYAEHEVDGLINEFFSLVHPDDMAGIKTAIADHLASRTPQYRSEFRLRSKLGAWVWYANYGKVMDGDSDSPGQRFVGVTFNIDERKRKEDEIREINRQLAEKNALLEIYNLKLEKLASSDSLTGLANRRKLMELGVNESKRTERFRHSLSLLMIDIDFFKAINDAWGHQVGDRVICAVADTCRGRVRSDLDTIARVGGEEFVIMLPETDNPSARRLAESLRQAVSALQVLANGDGAQVSVSVSIGVATQDAGNLSFEQLMNRADKALYKAKQAGRNNVQDFDDTHPPDCF